MPGSLDYMVSMVLAHLFYYEAEYVHLLLFFFFQTTYKPPQLAVSGTCANQARQAYCQVDERGRMIDGMEEKEMEGSWVSSCLLLPHP